MWLKLKTTFDLCFVICFSFKYPSGGTTGRGQFFFFFYATLFVRSLYNTSRMEIRMIWTNNFCKKKKEKKKKTYATAGGGGGKEYNFPIDQIENDFRLTCVTNVQRPISASAYTFDTIMRCVHTSSPCGPIFHVD